MFRKTATTAPLNSTEWKCAFCNETFSEGSICPNEDQHWIEFMDAMTRPRSPHLERGAA